MKRAIISGLFLVSLFSVSVPADVTVTVAEGTAWDQKAEISIAISGGAVVRGLALKVTLTGAQIDAVGDLQDVMAGFDAYIDYYYSNTGFLGTTLGGDEHLLPGIPQGAHALANPDAAGVLDLSTPKSVFSISLGVLDNTGAQGGVTAGGQLCKIALTVPGGQCPNVCIEPDMLRGGIVGDNLGIVTVSGCITISCCECFNNNLGNYQEWIQFGKPDCWCYRWNCRGDADGKTEGTTKTGIKHVYLLDLAILSSAYNVAEAPKGPGIMSIPNGICADFDRAPEGTTKTGIKRVYLLDLGILSTNYNVAEPTKGPGVPACPPASSGGELNYYYP